MLDQPEDLAWIRLDDVSSIGAARRTAADVARRLGFSESRTAEVAIAVTELATNAVVHASAGSAIVRVRRRDEGSSVEIVIADSGPGMAEGESWFEDGRSSAGTLGVGLGAVRRLANAFDVFSTVGHGTALHGTFSADLRDVPPRRRFDGLTRPITGETVCGDAWACVQSDDRVAAIIADGLGHGELAALASRAAIESFLADPWSGPAGVVSAAHHRLQGTRGAAVLALELEQASGTVRTCGVGNVVGRITGVDRSAGLVSHPGIVGHRMGRLREETSTAPPGSIIVLYSDGLTSKWVIDDWPGLVTFSPTIIAAVLLREAGLRQDDASVVVLQAGP